MKSNKQKPKKTVKNTSKFPLHPQTPLKALPPETITGEPQTMAPQTADGDVQATDATNGHCACTLPKESCSHCERSSSLKSSSSACSLLSFDSYPVEDYDKLWRIYTASVKGFTIGAGLKGGLAVFAVLSRLRRRRSLPSSKKVEMTSWGEDMILAVKETIRYGLFLGTFAGTFVSVDEIVAALGGHRRTAKWRALLAGAIAGPSMLLTGFNTDHTSLAIYILMRAAVLASRCGIKSKRFGSICKPLTWAHGDIFLMCLSSSQILSSYILKQESLPPSYRSFLNKHGGKDAFILQGVREMANGLPLTNLDVIEKHYKFNDVDLQLDPLMKVPCSIIHGKQACAEHFVSFLMQAYKRALPVYLPVYLIPALIVHRQGLLKRPYTIVAKSFLGVARMWTCILFRIFNKCTVPLVAAGTFPTGLALGFEKKSRRIEISLYCLARAIESFFSCMADAGYCRPSTRLKRADVAIFSLSTAIIMHCYAVERDVFRSKYLNVLDWVFGVPLSPYNTTPRKKG